MTNNDVAITLRPGDPCLIGCGGTLNWSLNGVLMPTCYECGQMKIKGLTFCRGLLGLRIKLPSSVDIPWKLVYNFLNSRKLKGVLWKQKKRLTKNLP